MSDSLHRQLDELTTCPVCLDTFEDPRLLPCAHTFCLRCLRAHFHHAKTGHQVPCPVCRDRFRIPDDGLAGLRRHYVVQSLIEGRESEKSEADKTGWEPRKDSDDNTKLAEVPDVDCSQKLCGRSSNWAGTSHTLKSRGATNDAPIPKEFSPMPQNNDMALISSADQSNQQKGRVTVKEERTSTVRGGCGRQTTQRQIPAGTDDIRVYSSSQHHGQQPTGCLQSRGSVVDTLVTRGHVCGVTSLDQHLYVLCESASDHVEVYSKTQDFTLVRRVTVPALSRHGMWDMTSSHVHACLYISDCETRTIHRLAPDGSAQTQWPISEKPHGLSLTPSSNLLVSVSRKLLELSGDGGNCLREIQLETAVRDPWHALELTDGRYAVCHVGGGGRQRVVIVGVDGRVLQCRGNHSGSGVEELDDPCHLALDRDGSILVADHYNARVVRLSHPRLEFVRDVVSELWPRPERLHLDHVTGHLFVSLNDSVAVVEMHE